MSRPGREAPGTRSPAPSHPSRERRARQARRIRRIVQFTLAGLVAIVALAAAAIAARLAVGPVSIMALAPSIQEKLSERLYYAYRIEFDDVTIAWRGGSAPVEVRLESVRIRDYSSDVIATIPAIATHGEPFALLKGEGGINSITVERPKIRWIESAGGAIRFDIGADQPGMSGKILEDFLITIASAPDPTIDARPLPKIEAVDADILIANELDGTSYRMTNAHIIGIPDRLGVRATYAFDLALGSTVTRLTAESLFKTADQRIDLIVRFDGLAPSDLKGALPMPAWLAAIDTPFGGIVEFDMDRLFHIGRVDLDASGGGSGIAVSARVDQHEVFVEGTVIAARRDVSVLADKWPHEIQGGAPEWLLGNQGGSEEIRIKAEGTVKDGVMALDGRVEPDGAPVTISGTIDEPRLVIDSSQNEQGTSE